MDPTERLVQALEKRREGLHLNGFEKTVVAGIVAASFGMLGWTVNTTNTTAKEVAVIKSQISDIRAGTADRYTRTQAITHAREMDRRVTRLESAHGLN